MMHPLLSLPARACLAMTPDLPVTDFSDLTALVPLNPEAIAQAVQLSEAIADGDQQWQTYLQSLALLGVQQWLEAGATDLAAAVDHPAAVVQVNGFCLGVVPLPAMPEAMISLPTPPGSHHLWLLVEVLEELEQVQIHGGLRADQLAALATGTSPRGRRWSRYRRLRSPQSGCCSISITSHQRCWYRPPIGRLAGVG
ncbi:MAG: DUF1822 family protein [Leptolyngbya sp. RL_3_1]|nr:DUF1822 family protein [Leptolyngbya sp. RL_3_1]